MIDKEFYISLPSNVSMNEFPNNKQSNYTTLLETPLEFTTKYQVCLKDISNFSNFNIPLGKITFQNLLFTDLEHREQNITFLRRRRQLHFRLYFARILFYEASNLRLFMPSRSLISYKWQLDIVVVIIVGRKVVRDHHLSCRHFVRNNRFEADVAFWRNSFVRHFFII